MIWPVRVPADAQVHACGPVVRVSVGHPAYPLFCPVCDEPIGDEPMVLVYVGVEPDNRRDGWMRGAGIPVHAVCTNMPKEGFDAEPIDGTGDGDALAEAVG